MNNLSLVEFCEKYKIEMTLKRKWYEHIFESAYLLRMIKHEDNLLLVKLLYESLVNAVEEAKIQYSEEIKNIAAFTNQRLNISMPDIDFSELDGAVKALHCYWLYFKSGGGIYQKMYAETRKIWKAARIDIIRKAVRELPTNKNVVVIKTTLNPTYEETKYNFSKRVEELARSPKKGIASINIGGVSEWIAFCPRVQEVVPVIKIWLGHPVGVKVSYF